MGHIGLTPQSINTLGSFGAQGREEGSWEPIENDARAVAEAGAFSVVIEAVAEPLARKITETIAIPTIGIGASAACDGQVLVLEDMLGLSRRTPKFVRRYSDTVTTSPVFLPSSWLVSALTGSLQSSTRARISVTKIT